MDFLESLILGIVQGITEFLPISSSGHLAFFKHVLGVKIQNPLGFDIALHVGTTLSVIIYMKDEIIRTFYDRRKVIAVFTSFIFTVPVALLMESFAEYAEENMLILSLSFFIGGIILIFLPNFKLRVDDFKLKYPIIGIFQGISAIPGVSRSGTTISACLFVGMSKEEAFNFSFILSIPTIISAILYEIFSVFRGKSSFGDVGFMNLSVGIISSFFFGLLALYVLKKIVIRGKLWLFGIYMLFISGLIFLLNFSISR